jgi:hypothetical protein
MFESNESPGSRLSPKFGCVPFHISNDKNLMHMGLIWVILACQFLQTGCENQWRYTGLLIFDS